MPDPGCSPAPLPLAPRRRPPRHLNVRPHGHTATRPPGHRATRPPDDTATGPHGHPAHRLQAKPPSPPTRPPGHPATRPPGHAAHSRPFPRPTAFKPSRPVTPPPPTRLGATRPMYTVSASAHEIVASIPCAFAGTVYIGPGGTGSVPGWAGWGRAGWGRAGWGRAGWGWAAGRPTMQEDPCRSRGLNARRPLPKQGPYSIHVREGGLEPPRPNTGTSTSS